MSKKISLPFSSFLKAKKQSKSVLSLQERYYLELEENIAWILKNNPYTRRDGKLTLYEATLALGLEWDSVDLADGETKERKTNPESIVQYFITCGKMKSLRVHDVAEFILLRDISWNIEDDLEDFNEVYRKIKENPKQDKQKLVSYALSLSVPLAVVKMFLKNMKKEANNGKGNRPYRDKKPKAQRGKAKVPHSRRDRADTLLQGALF